jgi:purine-nucleoside phosphorylase
MFKKINEATSAIQKIVNHKPEIGLVLGSGLGIYANDISNQTVIPYEKIPYFHKTSVEGHEGKMIFGTVAGKQVVALQGRIHAYEGYPMDEVVLPVRTLGLLGIKHLIVSNASGGINPTYKPGDLVMIQDHVNLSGKNPLIGPNIAELGTRFPDMSDAYNNELRKIFIMEAKKIGIQLKEGVYCWLSGPSYETPAEIRMLSKMGVDMVGMSTVPEVIAAHHMGIKVAGVSCITNYAAGIKDEKLSHQDVKLVAEIAMKQFRSILSSTIGKL